MQILLKTSAHSLTDSDVESIVKGTEGEYPPPHPPAPIMTISLVALPLSADEDKVLAEVMMWRNLTTEKLKFGNTIK